MRLRALDSSRIRRHLETLETTQEGVEVILVANLKSDEILDDYYLDSVQSEYLS